MHIHLRFGILCLTMILVTTARAETLRQAQSLAEQLESTDPAFLVQQILQRGDPQRGALVFFKSAAACSGCHASGDRASPLGPDLATVGQDVDGKMVSDEHLVESLLFPSRRIRPGFETVSILTVDNTIISGMLVGQRDGQLVLRDAKNLDQEIVIDEQDIEQQSTVKKSMMPDGLISSLQGQRQFLDLARYVLEVARGGPARAAQLKPSDEQLAVRDDSADLDHAGIIKGLKSRDFEAGKTIYHGYCFNCHGSDGNRPSLATARAFGTQKLKFGADPYRMFMTLTRGNGLMAPMSHLTPKERYQVVHYIREQFMKPSNPDYLAASKDYLASLPKGSRDGTEVPDVQRDFGPALASQLGRQFGSVLTIDLGGVTVSYDLHTMNQANVWSGGFLDLSTTQHARDRGEGTAQPEGTQLKGLRGWQWGHDGTLDYPRENLLPRGPMPREWMDYAGHYLHGKQVVLRYTIDGREILEMPSRMEEDDAIRHTLQIGPGASLVLCAAVGTDAPDVHSAVMPLGGTASGARQGNASEVMAFSGVQDQGRLAEFTASAASGDCEGAVWRIDDQHRLILHIPEDSRTRVIEIACKTGVGQAELETFGKRFQPPPNDPPKPGEMIAGGPLLWPEVLTTVGLLGLQQSAYALDTLTIPDSNPWNTWFRTSALDFFPDGRMAVATYGGDVWIVSGIDDQLLDVKWKRFAAGLYEPFGLKIAQGDVFVTCKDRIVRLHDQDHNGEADFYQSFSADTDVSVNFHAFNFDLQTDSHGNFYYSKSGHGADFSLPGAVIKVSADGRQREVYCTGFRTPNGMGIMPGDLLTASDNQGQWTPASKVSLLKPGGFYGWVPTYSIPGMWAPDGGKLDLKKVVAPTDFERPLVWMPQEFDNSSGGQLWVDDPRWGPLSNRLLHTSFGKGWMSYLMIQWVDDVAQAAIIKLPLDFQTGIMRARVNPADGQVYAVGLQGWNGGGRIGLRDSGIQRVRYTGKPLMMVRDCQVEKDGLRLMFNFSLDPKSATDPSSYVVEHWNYRWQSSYGSEMYSPTTDEVGKEAMRIVSVALSQDGKSVKLTLPSIQTVDQVHLLLHVQSDTGQAFAEEIYWTINRVPDH